MTLDDLKARIPAFAKDVKLNLSNLIGDESLEPTRKWGLVLACALATRNPEVAGAFDGAASAYLTPAARDAARAAASIMAMNNVYYRFLHLASNAAYQTMPARLRMTVIANPGVDKVDFELWALAVSAINGCGLCIDSHEKVLTEAGVAADVIQTAVRFAAIIQSVAVALEAGDLPGLAAAQ